MLVPTASEIGKAPPHLTSKVAIFVHGLFLTEESWRFREDPSVSYGSVLQRDFGVTPFYVRYNTGRSFEANSRQLASLLDSLWSAYPVPVDSAVLVGHSMGGNVLSMATGHAMGQGQAWVDVVQTMIHLGTPHTGSWNAQSTHRLSNTAAKADPLSWVFGDMLVGQLSASGRTVAGRQVVPIPRENYRRFRLSHSDLARAPTVGAQISEWVAHSDARSPMRSEAALDECSTPVLHSTA